MHELMVTESILEIALRHAQDAQARRITDLYLVIGDLATIVDDSVQFYWDFVSENTIAEGAKLHFRRNPAVLACQVCGQSYSLDQDLTCPSCRSSDIRIVSGQEFYLEAIEVSDSAIETSATS